jgi:hypothetical protein
MTEKPLLVPLAADEWSEDEYAAVRALMGIPGRTCPPPALGTHQAMELVFVFGTYSMLAMACDTWALTPPSGSAKLPDRTAGGTNHDD